MPVLDYQGPVYTTWAYSAPYMNTTWPQLVNTSPAEKHMSAAPCGGLDAPTKSIWRGVESIVRTVTWAIMKPFVARRRPASRI